MKDKVSVIVPVYNTECYLKKCIDSIRRQTYQDLDIIIVDDGSSDQCGKLCDQIAESDARIRVLHKKNGGLSVARNAGIRIASGEYLVFCDSDDWMETNIIKTALDEIKKADCQMIIWGYSADVVNKNDALLSSSRCAIDAMVEVGNAGCLTRKEAQGLIGYAWNKLYRRDIVVNRQIQFENGISLVEDVLFNSCVLMYCNRVKFINTVGTHYIQRKLTTLGNAYYYNYSELILKAVNAKKSIMEHFLCETAEIEKTISTYTVTALKVGILNIVRDNTIDAAKKRDRLRDFVKTQPIDRLTHLVTATSLKDKLFLMLLRKKAVELLTKTSHTEKVC